MIKVFKSPVGARELKDLQTRIEFCGRRVLSIKRHEVDDFWLVKTADRAWFEALPNEKQLRVVLGIKSN
jgi:hypothetical protein